MTVGAVLIVKNEEVMLRRCLDSLIGMDEIIILDTGSTDGTEKLVASYVDEHPTAPIKAYFGEYKWEDSFCKARNAALAKSTTDCVLSIDADEYIEKDGVAKLRALAQMAPQYDAFDILLVDESNGSSHYFPRFFRRKPEIKWNGDIHNTLNKMGQTKTNVTITYGASPAHAADPNRAFRILKKYVANNPRCVREKFYLAREYMYRHLWTDAIKWYEIYLTVGEFPRERAEAHFQTALAYRNLGNYEEARKHCMASIYINNDYYSPIELLAYLSGPQNKDRWLLFSESATNEGVLFAPGKREKGPVWYDCVLENDNTMERYDKIHDRIVELVGERVAIDVGCGTGRLLARLPKGSFGFDISPVGVKKCLDADLNVEIGDAYGYQYMDKPFEVLIATEILEHVDDKRVVSRIPHGTKCIFSAPSFIDPSHVRFYTKKYFLHRLGEYLDDIKFEMFYWDNKSREWTKDHIYTNDYIMLITATRK